MFGPAPSTPSACRPSPPSGICQAYWPGHQMHFIHARKIGEEPWGWRDGVVVSVEADGWLEVNYVLEPGHVVAHHHQDLTAVLSPGDPVRIHERYYALGGRFGWVNLYIAEGIGSVPEPEHPELWRGEMTVAVTDLHTGRALPMDRIRHTGEDS